MNKWWDNDRELLIHFFNAYLCDIEDYLEEGISINNVPTWFLSVLYSDLVKEWGELKFD